jgi:hypothetical protein
MNQYTLGLASLIFLAGCASIGAKDSDRRFIGTVERSQKISRAGEPSGALMAFGLLGGLLHHAASQPSQTNLYFVRVQSDVFTVQVDDEFAAGACVELIPSKDAFLGKSYVYGQARLRASTQCPISEARS